MHEFAQATSILKFYDSRRLGKQRIVTADSNIDSRLISCPALPDNDRTAGYKLSGKSLYSKPLGLAVSAVSGASNSLFVCHVSLLACHLDLIDADGRALLPMAARTAILLFCLIFKDQNLVVFILRFQSPRYRGPLHARLTDIGLFIGFDQEHIVKFHRGALLGLEFLHADYVPFGDAILLSAAHYHCVHDLTSRREIGNLTKK